jgi:hypothetical protein
LAIFFATIGITDNVSITFHSVTPLGFWGIGVYPKVSFKLAPGVRFGFVFNVGFLSVFAFGTASGVMYGGAPVILTLGSEDHNVTLSLHLEGVSGTTNDSLFFIVPDVGASFKIARHVKLHAELWSMLSTKGDWKTHGFNGRTWGVALGCRIFWDDFYIDISTVALVIPDWVETWGGNEDDEVGYIEELVPGGGPMISFGFRI